jgi:hypothetical protein
MKKGQRSILAFAIAVVFIASAMLLPGFVSAGDLEPPAGPESTDSAMYTMEDVYDRLNSNIRATKRSGAFTEPSAAPGSTGHTLDEVYHKAIPTQVEKTGQTGCWDTSGNPISCAGTGQDGDLEKGIAWPSPRFVDNGDGTVTDNLTGLIWLKNANCFGPKTWATALSGCNGLASGSCGLSGGSVAGDWRLPNMKELQSLNNLSLPNGHPFTNVDIGGYWSSTTHAFNTSEAWGGNMLSFYVSRISKASVGNVWPVRGGN